MKWEYRMEIAYLINRGKRRLEGDALEALGKNGWELINICEDIAYFKRPLEEVNGREEKLLGMYDALQEIGASLREHGVDLNKLEKEVLSFRRGNGREEKEAALKEEENKEDQGESEGATFVCVNCTHRCTYCPPKFRHRRLCFS